ncbi:MAG: Coenzyme [Planctomycetota bacterium]|nr:MAG: Coenzyme [Planctomycetota bacterium]
MSASITAELKRRNPLITAAAAKTLHRIKEHPHAPRFNGALGDRLVRADLAALDRLREGLASGRRARTGNSPAPEVIALLAAAIPRVERFRRTVPRGHDLAKDWASVATTSREDLAFSIHELIPDDADFARLIVHPTSGTTGHAVFVPHHPVAGSAYLPLFEVALASHGVRLAPGAADVGTVQVHAQSFTLTYATVHAAWGNSGYAKVNLKEADWPKPESRSRWLEAMAPLTMTGNPSAYAELLDLAPKFSPKAFFSTAFALAPALAKKLSARYRAPVIDWYSSIETGPIAYTCPRGEFHVLPHDLHVEVVDAKGLPLPAGKFGEICVSGGRNPFLPMLRYRTGDRARLETKRCPCGDPMPRLLDLEGRAAVRLRAADGSPVASVDVSRALRDFAIAQHALLQRAGGAVELDLRPLPGWSLDTGRVERAVRGVFGAKTKLRIRLVQKISGPGVKVAAFRSELR